MDGGKYEAILEENLLETLKHTKQFTKTPNMQPEP